MHIKGPLKADKRPLDRAQHPEGENERQRDPQRHMDPDLRMIEHFHRQHGRNDDMSDNGDGEIGRCVVGPVMVDFLTTVVAVMDRGQKALEQFAPAAGGAGVHKAAGDRLQRLSGRLGRISGFRMWQFGPVLNVHRFFFPLVRPAEAFEFLTAARLRGLRGAVPGFRRDFFAARPLLRISKRRAPANGAASASLTVTWSPS